VDPLYLISVQRELEYWLRRNRKEFSLRSFLSLRVDLNSVRCCAGVDINTIRGWLGHVSLDTTNIYAEIDLETKAKALATCDISDHQRSKPWRRQPALMEFLHGL